MTFSSNILFKNIFFLIKFIRHKDILNQNQQLQSILSQAVERIHGLQDTNKKLTEHIHILEYGSGYKNSMGGFPPPPPDVF